MILISTIQNPGRMRSPGEMGDKYHSARVTKVIYLQRREGYICACTVVLRTTLMRYRTG